LERSVPLVAAEDRIEELAPPDLEVFLDPLGAILENAERPDAVVLQIPAQIARLDRPERRGEGRGAPMDAAALGVRRRVAHARPRDRAMRARLLVHARLL